MSTWAEVVGDSTELDQETLHVLGLHTLARMWGKFRSAFGEKPADAMLDSAAESLVGHWAEQWRQGAEKETIADLVSIYRNQAGSHAEHLHHAAPDRRPETPGLLCVARHGDLLT